LSERIPLAISRLRLGASDGHFTNRRSALRTSHCELPISPFVRASHFALWLGLLFLASGCGYRLAGKATAIPANIDSVAIPIFNNQTTKYRLEQRLTSAVVDEFVARTRYRIVPDASQAKAVLTGQVTEFTSTPVIFAGGAGATFLVTVRMRVSMKDTTTHKLLFENNNFFFREEFEISRGSKEFFPEEGPAMDRLAREFSRTLVSTILEAF
jgi:hypothetical protein